MRFILRNLEHKTSVYLASGWFNPDQERTRLAIQVELEKHGISYFSPKDDVENTNAQNAEGKPDWKKIFEMDVHRIDDTDFTIVNTTGKDMGTLFESGYSYAKNHPIIYYFEAPEGAQFNCMLAQSSIKVVKSQKELSDFLDKLIENNFDFEKCAEEYKGEQE